MARVTHVKKAQQRFATVPVIDPETNEPKRTPVMKNGEQKTTKRGKPVFMTVTARDKTKPLPPERCDYHACPVPDRVIAVGTAYKWIQPKSGPYGGRRLTRHESCPTWQVWEYSSSLSARLAQVSYNFWNALDGVDNTDDVQSALDDAAQEIKDIAEEKRESASNIEEGFGHETSASQELNDVADQLDDWAGEVETADIPDIETCDDCGGDGTVECGTCGGAGEQEVEQGEGMTECEDCSGTGTVECESCSGTGESLDDWRESLQDSLSIIDESPV
jgi:hypothetical protein